MTARRYLQTRLQRLRDVRDILGSMKNLAYMETHKLASRIEAQHRAVGLVESAASDFLAHFSAIRANAITPRRHKALIIVGSERGFCGSFNEQLRQALSGLEEVRLVVVGRKLAGKLSNDPRFEIAVEGAIVADETAVILNKLVSEIGKMEPFSLSVLFHDEDGGVSRITLLPPFRDLPTPVRPDPIPPLFNLPPQDFFMELVDHYLFALLHRILFVSLFAENQQRMHHLEGAVQRLDEQLAYLERRRHQLRQEEIVEEIEVILLNADS